MNLNDAPTGLTLTVVSINNTDKSHAVKLTAMGILPGVRVKLIQKKPIPVFQIGLSKFAIDRELAGIIDVE